jgi:hypothetical protein
MISENNRPELFAALSKMQGELTGAFKAKSGHGYSYADLSMCIQTAQEPLRNNGLAVVQFLTETEAGTQLETIVTHEAGGYMSSSFLMAKAVLMGGGGKNPAQAMGATISYMRRYAYSAAIGLAQTDDDAVNCKLTHDDLSNHIESSGFDLGQTLAAFKVANIKQIKDIQQAFDQVTAWANTSK